MPGNDFPLRGENPAWLNSLDAASQREWRSLTRETDPQLYQEGLLHFAGRQERRNQEAVAGAIYSAMLENSPAPDRSALARARERLAVLNGGGSGGARAEYLLRHASHELFDPTMIAAMGTAGAVFRMTRLAALARLGSGAPGLLTRGWGASGLASVAGFAIEAPTFTLTHRLGRAALGHSQDWSSSALSRDLASSYLVLGALKLGARGATGLQGLSGYRSPMASALFQQSGMFGGIVVSQALERRLGWRPAASTEAAAADALVTWLQFNAAGRLTQSVLGPRFQTWEREMETRSAALERLPRPGSGFFETLSPQLAAVGPAPAHRPSSVEPIRPPLVLMSTSKFGKGFEGLTGLGESRVRGEEASARPVDPRRAFLRVEVPRTVRSGFEGEPGYREFQYRLVLEDFQTFLREGGERVIATRDGGEIRLRLIERDMTKEGNEFLPAGLPGYRFEILEGETRGIWSIYAFAQAIMSFNLVTSPMRPGVGGIVLDWMATQAAVEGRQSQFVAITNLDVFMIIEKRGLIEEASAVVEAHQWGRRHRRQSIPLGRFGDWSFLQRNLRGYYNIWAFPRPSLLPPTLRTVTVDRELVSRLGEAHPYQLRLSPFRNFLHQGREGVIATREGESLSLRTESSILSPNEVEFLPKGMPIIRWTLREGEKTGSATFHLNGDNFELLSLKTDGMRPGAGGIFMHWLATQAAIHQRNFGVLYIENPKILQILESLQLMEEGTPLQECYRVGSGIDARTIGYIANHRKLVTNPYADFFLVRGRPSPNLVPPELRTPTEAEPPSPSNF
ncbi:MAG TPA: hypothetical protein VJP40_01580 [bacterium]|nr:hypothetical protein [bacterium]